MKNKYKVEVIKKVKDLIKNGSNYNINALDEIYHPDLKIIKLDDVNNVTVINKDENMAYFKEQNNIGAQPLSEEAEFLYSDADESFGHVIVKRKMKMKDRLEELIFSINLINKDNEWVVLRETALVKPI